MKKTFFAVLTADLRLLALHHTQSEANRHAATRRLDGGYISRIALWDSETDRIIRIIL